MNDSLHIARTAVGAPALGSEAPRRRPAAPGSAARFFAAAGRGIGALVLPANAAFDVLRILWLATAFAMFLLYVGCFQVQSDAADYMLWADALAGKASLAGHPSLHWRDIGYSLVLLASGFPWTHSFIGVTIIGACMAIATPVLAYFTLRPWFPRAAYWIALMSIVSLAPFLMFKVIHHDQPYNFFLVAVAWSLARYGATKRPVHVYAFALFSFALTLTRLLGQTVFPVLAVLSYLQSRANLKHFLIAAALFVLGIAAYSSYRSHAMAGPQAALGQQVIGMQAFWNMYLHLADSNVAITPDAGPNTARFIEQLHEHLLPSPAQSPDVLRVAGVNREFMHEYFTRYSADELTAQILRHPNREYYYLIVGTIEDRLLLLTTLELALRHPGYVVSYTLRNALHLLYDPGYHNARHFVPPFTKEGNNFSFSGGEGQLGYNIGDPTPEPALTEASFLAVLHLPSFFKTIHFFLETGWFNYYQPVAHVLFCLMMVTWASMAVGLAARLVGTPASSRWSDLWLSDRVTGAAATLSLLLFVNVGMTALLADPLYRYDYSILMLKIMLAGIGCAVLIHLGRAALGKGTFRAERPPATLTAPVARAHIATSWALLALALAVGFGGWVWYMRTVATGVAPEGTIRIVSASYGQNCGAPPNNEFQHLHSACVGAKRCGYIINGRVVRDAVPGCWKDFRVEWRCSDGGEILKRRWPEDPQVEDRLLEISCAPR